MKNADGAPLYHEVVTDDRAFRALEDAWNELCGQASYDCIYMNFFWLFTSWKHYQRADSSVSLLIVCIYERSENRPVGILPLMRRRIPFKKIFKIDQISFLSDTFCDECAIPIRAGYVDSIAGYIRDVILGELLIPWHEWKLRSISGNNPLLKTLQNALANSGFCCRVNESSRNYYLSTTNQSFKNYIGSLRSGFRQNLRTAKNRLEEYAADKKATYGMREITQWTAEGIHSWIAMDLRRQESKGRQTAYRHEAYREFVAELMIQYPQWISVLSYDFNDEVMAFSINLNYKGRCIYWSPTLNADFEKYSPGQLLLEKIVERCFENRQLLDFSAGDSAYKSRWTSTYHPVFTMRVTNPRRRLFNLLSKL